MIEHARDLDDEKVIDLIAACNEGRCEGGQHWHGGAPGYAHTPGERVQPHTQNLWDLARVLDAPEKVVLAKLRRLQRRGRVKGCTCGCRGDFEAT